MTLSNRALSPEQTDELPFYRPQGNEISLFEYAYHHQLPVLLKGPTG